MRKTKTIEKEVWVCDNCYNELDVSLLAQCDKCGKEICGRCKTMFEIKLLKWEKGVGVPSLFVSSQDEVGLRGIFCSCCYNELEGTLLTLGFKHFKSSIIPV